MAGEKTDQSAQQAQNFYNKGVAAFERGNLDIAIDLLVQFEEQIEEPEVHRLGERAGLG